MDYSTGTIHIYKCDNTLELSDKYIANLGFNLDEIYWMAGDYLNIVRHHEILTTESIQQ